MAFPVSVPSAETIGHLKDLIKTKQTPKFDDIAANQLTSQFPLFHLTIVLSEVESAIELDPTDDISGNFEEKPTSNKKNALESDLLSSIDLSTMRQNQSVTLILY